MEIIYEDNNIIVIHKEAGIATQTSDMLQKDIVSELRNYLGEDSFLGVVHRLDQNVEGLLVFAKDEKSAANLSKQLQMDCFNKEYIAKVSGNIPDGEQLLVDYLVSVPRGNITKVADKNNRMAKRCELSFSKAEKEGFVYIRLKTGRKHQIRVQLSHAGLPIVGDMKYGDETPQRGKRLCLMAYHLSFNHPVSGERLDYELPLSLTNSW